MNRKKRIETILKNNFIKSKIEVFDESCNHDGHNNFTGKEESHFKIIIEDRLDLKKKILQTHRQINDLLKEEFSSGLHALEIKIIIN